MDRRRFLQLSGGAALAAAVAAACGTGNDTGGSGDAAGAASGGGGSRKVKLGFIALTDCASLVMAKELGYFSDRDLDVTLEKQASWPATRDALINGQIDGAHCLFSMPLAVAAGIGGTAGDTSLKIAMTLNNNGQAITLKNDFAAAGYGDLSEAKQLIESNTPTMAMTFPGGTHDIWLRYWLQAVGVDQGSVDIIPIPPPQMVANMKVNTMDGYCVGEPWNAVAVQQDIGFTHLATQDLWTHHPEKALVVNEQFAGEQQAVLKDVMGAVLMASQWLDDLSNRAEAAEVLGAEAYVNAPAADIEGRLTGEYELGADLGDKTFTDDTMLFFRDGQTNAPRRAHALWFLAQYERLGLLDQAPDYDAIADGVLLRGLYEEVAAAEGIDVPDDDMAPFDVKLDDAIFDPNAPQEEAQRS